MSIISLYFFARLDKEIMFIFSVCSTLNIGIFMRCNKIVITLTQPGDRLGLLSNWWKMNKNQKFCWFLFGKVKPDNIQEFFVGAPHANVTFFPQMRCSAYECGMIDSYRGIMDIVK